MTPKRPITLPVDTYPTRSVSGVICGYKSL